MNLLEAVIATGASKVVAKSRIAKLEASDRKALEGLVGDEKKLPKTFARDFNTAVAKAEKKKRGVNKAIKKVTKKDPKK